MAKGTLRALDLGCGSGSNTAFLANEGFDVTALDGSLSAVRRVGAGVVGDAAALPFKDESFDVCADIVCIAHNSFADARKIIAEVARVLRRGGRLFSVLPTESSWREPYLNKGPITFFDRAHVQWLFSKHFEIEINWLHVHDAGHTIKQWLVSALKPGV